MSLITHNGLLELVSSGVIMGVKPEHINAASIDITLASTIFIEAPEKDRIDLVAKETPRMDSFFIPAYYDLPPGHFILASSREVFNLPNDLVMEFRLKSSGARSGLDAALAMFCDPGWTNSTLTLELTNNLRFSHLRLRPGMKIGQVFFMRGEPVPDHASYQVKGQYNNDLSATPSKGLR